jgi:hypothetical protein
MPPGPLWSRNFRLLLAGPLAGAYGTSAVLTAGAILVLLLTAAVLLVPEVRNMQRRAVSPGQPEEAR